VEALEVIETLSIERTLRKHSRVTCAYNDLGHFSFSIFSITSISPHSFI
jgi:hypothetical protein